MKTILIITLLFLNLNLFAQKAIYTDNDGDGVIEYTLMDDFKKVLETGYYQNNKMVGTWTLFYPNGKKRVVAKFKNGIKQGLWLVYDDKGRILTEVFYKDDKKISASQHIYANN
jgi:antitoxin component YwqK of YwqJK toxin-antitoxin module